MKQHDSLFRRFLLGHSLFIFLPPILLLLFFAIIGVSSISEEKVNTINLFYVILLLFCLIMVAFVIMSWLFFLKLRERLTRLQKAMEISADGDSFPKSVPVQTERMDEIDKLGSSFNWMVQQIEESRKRANEEELLRRRLIANLSHDLRTPLTILRGHVTRLNKESISAEGQNSLTEMDLTITRFADLMEDLLAYTLLTSEKYPFQPDATDIGRLVRASVAAWYPAFEAKAIQLDIDLPAEQTFYWETDPKWMTRVMDNLLQNILLHASEGKYASILVDVEKEQIIIADRGPGMDHSSHGRGAGIGLSTSNYMLQKMKLQARFISNEKGTIVTICRA